MIYLIDCSPVRLALLQKPKPFEPTTELQESLICSALLRTEHAVVGMRSKNRTEGVAAFVKARVACRSFFLAVFKVRRWVC